ncbi:MAG: acyltransferase [Crocinitomicaceae bacterium]|nr:acyltransferase [Crocinitomicaceae bacterium]
MGRKKRLHFKDLDALRFIAFIPVFLYCALYLMSSEDNPFISDMGNAMNYIKQNSIDFFFFLSSFLLTSHALREYKYHKSFALKSFYIRRMMRIFPVFAVALLFTFLIHPWIIKELGLTPISVPKPTSYVFLFPNYFAEITKEQYIYLVIVWTVYMFIQFYVFWGIILKFFIQQLKIVGIILVVVGIFSRVYHALSDSTFEFDTLSAGIPIGIGAFVAHIIRNDERTVDLIKHLSKGTHLLLYMGGVGALALGYLFFGDTLIGIIVPLLTCTFFGYVVIEQTYAKESLLKFRKNKIISRFGKISYGLIVYQSIIMVLGIIAVHSLEFDLSTPIIQIFFLIFSFTMTWLVADLSYRLYERPILNIKKEFKRS